MNFKKILIPLLLVAIPITTGLSSYFLTIHCVNKAHEKELRRIAQEYYDNKVKQFKEENKTLTDVDISFIGDSLTDAYDVKYYYPEYNVVNRGIGGDTTFGVERRLDVSAYEVNPKVLTLLIGANNFKTMFDNYENILKGFKENIPHTKVILLSLTSMTYQWGRNNQIAQENNKRIKTYADEYGYTYVDLYNPLLDPSTNELKEEYTTDGGHFTPLGYEKVTSIIKPVVTSLLIL